MTILFILLTIGFVVVLVLGFVSSLVERGKTTTRAGSAVGSELMAEKTARDGEDASHAASTGWAFFRGKGWAVERQVAYSYAEIRQRFREGGIRPVLPALLVAIGMLGSTFFLALTLLVALDNKLVGLVMLAFPAYAAYLLASGLLRKE